MATVTSLRSPGVQLSEIDLSLSPVLNNATTVFVPGFAPTGPVNDSILVSGLTEFQQIYGLPTNGAERYFYHTVRAALNSPASVVVSRLPYGDSSLSATGSTIGLLAYPGYWVDTTDAASVTATSSCTYAATGGTYVLGKPAHYNLTREQFDEFKQGSLFSYQSAGTTSDYLSGESALNGSLSSLGFAALIVANQSQSIINSMYEGYYIGIADNTNLNPACDFDTIGHIKTVVNHNQGVTNYLGVPAPRISFPLSATSMGVDGSLSEQLESSIPSFDIYSGREFDDTIIVGLFKLSKFNSSSSSIQLQFSLEEGYVGSLDSQRQINTEDGSPATSFSIETVVNSSSPNLIVKVNPYLSRIVNGQTYLQPDGTPAVKIRCANATLNNSALFANNATNRSTMIGFDNKDVVTEIIDINGSTNAIYPVGSYYSADITDKRIGNVPLKLQTVLDNLLNVDLYQLNVACEAGLGTVYACSKTATASATEAFDDYAYVDVSALSAFDGTPVVNDLVTNYQAVVNTLQSFIENSARRDLLGILDPLTPILVQSNSVKTIKNIDSNFTQSILWPLKNLYAPYNTSYLCSFPQVVRIADAATGNPIWVPFSGYMAAILANMDTYYTPWSAPAGFTRGVVTGVSDLAYYPRQKQRDQLYTSNFNPVTFFTNEGFVIYGQKTLLKRPSAFNRINVRRLFLNLEIATRETLKYYVFEPNTLFTRTQVINSITPIFENAKNTQGVYDYLIICDERNNTPAVIDQNTMIVDIYIKPVRTAEFILANFFATQTGVNFQEIIGG